MSEKSVRASNHWEFGAPSGPPLAPLATAHQGSAGSSLLLPGWGRVGGIHQFKPYWSCVAANADTPHLLLNLFALFIKETKTETPHIESIHIIGVLPWIELGQDC